MKMKYANRRAALKTAKEPHIALLRQFSKASPWAKAGIVAAAVLPKAIFLGVGYAGAKSASKKEDPKKYMKG